MSSIHDLYLVACTVKIPQSLSASESETRKGKIPSGEETPSALGVGVNANLALTYAGASEPNLSITDKKIASRNALEAQQYASNAVALYKSNRAKKEAVKQQIADLESVRKKDAEELKIIIGASPIPSRVSGVPLPSQASFSRSADSEVVKILIPKKTLGQIKLMIDSVTGEKTPDFFFSYSDNQICFQLGTKILYSRTLSGQFPNYTLVLPTDDSIKTRVSINTQELRSAVKRVSKMSQTKTSGVKFFFGDNLLTLLAQDQAIGKGEEFIEIDNLEAFDIGVNSIYLMDFLNRVTTDRLSINFKDTKAQCLLIPENNEVEYKYVIMPIRI
jgi:DNA polymerase III beta subunit, C-terminal domain/DNA polymerase III beta subunit, central domain